MPLIDTNDPAIVERLVENLCAMSPKASEQLISTLEPHVLDAVMARLDEPTPVRNVR